MDKKFEISEGKTVWLVPTGNYARIKSAKLEEARVIKIARKYFYCVIVGWEKFPIKFSLEDFSSVCEDCNGGYDIYATPEMYVQKTEFDAMYSEVSSYFRNFGTQKPSFSTMSKITTLLYGEGVMTKAYNGFCKDLGGRYRIETIYANQNDEYEYGDIYSSRCEAAKNHPYDSIVFGFCVVDTTTGFIPEGCSDWCDTIEEAISDYENFVKNKEK